MLLLAVVLLLFPSAQLLACCLLFQALLVGLSIFQVIPARFGGFQVKVVYHWIKV